MRTLLNRWLKTLSLISLVCLCQPIEANQSPLPAAQAFPLSARLINSTALSLQWQVAPGYYLYRDRLSISSRDQQLMLGQMQRPAGAMKHDEFFGNQMIYRNIVNIAVPFNAMQPISHLVVTYQGCADVGYCYPPISKLIEIDLQQSGTLNISDPNQIQNTTVSEQQSIQSLFVKRDFIIILASFFGFGLLLSFTPCILPMLPILSGIILGQKQPITTAKAFRLSLTYTLSMATTYAFAGFIVSYLGSSLQTSLQKPSVIIGFSALFILLALSLIGLYEFRLPSVITNYCNRISNNQRGGTYIGAAIMGCLSILIVSPCITPPLIAALGYMTQTGNLTLGTAALFSMGLGFGLPLVFVGTLGTQLLPKSGNWMQTIKTLFGILLLAVAVDLMSRIVPESTVLYLWAVLLFTAVSLLGLLESSHTNWQRLSKSFGLLLTAYGIVLLAGASLGNSDPLRPLANLNTNHINQQQSEFSSIKNLEQLTQSLSAAQQAKQPVMLYFSAKWCSTCKSLERHLFVDNSVKAALNDMRLFKIDISAQTIVEQTIMDTYGVVAPPVFIFFDRAGIQQHQLQLAGDISATAFIQHIKPLTNERSTDVYKPTQAITATDQ